MFAVILLHTTSTYVLAESNFKVLGMNIAFILNQSVRFAVPMFVLLSGISFGMFQASSGPRVFFSRRLVKILLPYVMWCLVYYVYKNGMSFPDIGSFLRGIFTGNIMSHLYFVVVIVQLYVLAFPMKILTDRYPVQTLAATFILTYISQEVLYLTCFGTELLGGWLRVYLWELFPTWIFYFTAGICITGDRLERIVDFSKKYFIALLILFAVLIPLFSLDSRATGSYELSIKPIIIPYTAIVFLFVCGLSGRIQHVKFLDAIVKKLSLVSYTVYLSHVLFLMVLRNIPSIFAGTAGMLLLFVCVSIISIIFSLLWDVGLKLIKSLIGLGKYHGKARSVS
jgi:surface polysaccharide O-acyltransferase-like enzyme